MLRTFRRYALHSNAASLQIGREQNMSCYTVTTHFLGILCSIQIKNHYFSIFKLNELEDGKKKNILKGAFLDCYLLKTIIQFLVFLKWVSNLNLKISKKFLEIVFLLLYFACLGVCLFISNNKLHTLNDAFGAFCSNLQYTCRR